MSRKFLKISIELWNDAFVPNAAAEAKRILHEAADKVEQAFEFGLPLRDINGNRVGWIYTSDENK